MTLHDICFPVLCDEVKHTLFFRRKISCKHIAQSRTHVSVDPNEKNSFPRKKRTRKIEDTGRTTCTFDAGTTA